MDLVKTLFTQRFATVSSLCDVVSNFCLIFVCKHIRCWPSPDSMWRDSSERDASWAGNSHQWWQLQNPVRDHHNSNLHHLPQASRGDPFWRYWFGQCYDDDPKSRRQCDQVFQVVVGPRIRAPKWSSPGCTWHQQKLAAAVSMAKQSKQISICVK